MLNFNLQTVFWKHTSINLKIFNPQWGNILENFFLNQLKHISGTTIESRFLFSNSMDASDYISINGINFDEMQTILVESYSNYFRLDSVKIFGIQSHNRTSLVYEEM